MENPNRHSGYFHNNRKPTKARKVQEIKIPKLIKDEKGKTITNPNKFAGTVRYIRHKLN
jgi:hypothetical protein